jgi:hypothetical protein
MNVRVLGVLLVGIMAWACGSDDAPAGSGCPADDPSTPENESACRAIATLTAGREAVQKRGCIGCHGPDLSGSTTMLVRPNVPTTTPLGEPIELYPPNLTPDPTGVAPPERGGKWTDDALAIAIRTGFDEESQALCPQMTHFAEMSDFEVYSIVKYLRSLTPVSKVVPRSVCPPMKTKEQQSLPR